MAVQELSESIDELFAQGDKADSMAAMGLIEETYRLPMVAPRPASKEKIMKVLKELDLLKAALV